MRVALFGGSFNPPHLGHVLCALYAYKISSIDEIWVLPCIDHPYGKELAQWDQRWKLCAAAFAGLDFVRLRDDELRNEGGKTFNLVSEFRKLYPEHQWALIGGTDTAQDLPKWYRGEELQKMLEVIAVPRQGYDHDSASALPAISSSLVRERVANGESISDLVPEPVERLIKKTKLYRPA